MDGKIPGRALSWLAFAMLCAVYYGNFHVYDSISPAADLLQPQRRFTDTQLGMLNAIYSLPERYQTAPEQAASFQAIDSDTVSPTSHGFGTTPVGTFCRSTFTSANFRGLTSNRPRGRAAVDWRSR